MEMLVKKKKTHICGREKMHTQTKAHEHTEKFRAQLIKKKKTYSSNQKRQKKKHFGVHHVLRVLSLAL